MDFKTLLLYFVIGGTIFTAVTYFGSQAKGELAAFFTFLPTVSALSLGSIYLSAGTDAAVSLAKNMLLLLPSWLLYVVAVILLLPRIGIIGTLIISIGIYVGAAFLTIRLT